MVRNVLDGVAKLFCLISFAHRVRFPTKLSASVGKFMLIWYATRRRSHLYATALRTADMHFHFIIFFFRMIFRVHIFLFTCLLFVFNAVLVHTTVHFFPANENKSSNKNHFLFISHWFVSVFHAPHPFDKCPSPQPQFDNMIFTSNSWWVNSINTWPPFCHQITFQPFHS